MKSPKVKKHTEEIVGGRNFPVIKTSKGVEFLMIYKKDLKLVETTRDYWKYRILTDAKKR